MTNQLEERIARTLDRAGAASPVPDAAFFEGVRTRARLRRGRRRAGVAAVGVAVALIAGVVATVPRVGPSKVPPPPAQILPGPRLETTPPLADAQPMERVWPDAFHKLPLRLPDNREYSVIGALDRTHFLVQATPPPNASISPYGPPLVLDENAGTFVQLAAGAVPGFPTEGGPATVGDTHVLWAAYSQGNSPSPWYEVWAIPRAGGVPHRVYRAADTEQMLFGMRAVEGVAYLDVLGHPGPNDPPAGLLTVPLTGGDAQPVPDTGGFHLTDDGYAFRPEPRDPNITGGPVQGVTLLNLRNGERTVYFFAGDLVNVSCVPTWCGGSSVDSNAVVGVRLADEEVAVNRSERWVDGGVRFVWGMSADLPFQSLYAWDMQTGMVGTAPNLTGGADSWPDRQMPYVLTWRSADGYLGALDLGAIS